jgi:large subunit ribosomal protein L19e
MTIAFVKRTAAQILGRGESAIRLRESSLDDISKAITRDDVRRLISGGSVFALKAKKNLSMNSKILRQKREEGRRRGVGRRKGSRNARSGMTWEKKVRAQRFLLSELKGRGKFDNMMFRKLYLLVKGGSFADKAALLRKINDMGVQVSDKEVSEINGKARSMYK